MSRELPSGVRAKTGYFPDNGGNWIRHYAELDDTLVPMQEAVDALRAAFADPSPFADPRFNEWNRYVKSFYPSTVYDEDGFSSSVRFMPAIVEFPLDVDDLENNPGPLREVLGHELSFYDLISFTHYLLSNTPSEGPDDPRLIWLEELRGDREPQR